MDLHPRVGGVALERGPDGALWGEDPPERMDAAGSNYRKVLRLNAGMSKSSGVVQADTVITNSVVSASYTPGQGNPV